MPENTAHYLIWSWYHHQWWKPDKQGYTDKIQLAGVYTKQQAADIVLAGFRNQAVPTLLMAKVDGDSVQVETALIHWRNI